jgi:UDP-N-acetylmuramyl pentapeptide phosphotransferase/UDP-N-acetylglucosamine-1-phosphate transferase
MIYFIVALVSAFLINFLLIKYENLHIRYSADNDFSGVQKFHNVPVPRIGGISILIGLLVAGLLLKNQIFWLFIISIFPIFIIGIIEDIYKNIKPYYRLLTSFITAAIAVYILDIELLNIGWTWFDNNILGNQLIAIIITIFMIGGTSHSTNIIDGFNGLLLGFALMALLIFLFVSYQVGDSLVINFIYILIGSVLGLFLFNFPQAKIFTGDSGAYILGSLMACIALLLVKRNQSVSPWFALLVMSYPVFETFFSIYRKKILRNTSPGKPDAIHLHMLIYKRVAKSNLTLVKKFKRNAATSILIWLLVFPFMTPALIWWDNHLIMILFIILFCVYYVLLYFSIVIFKYPFVKKGINQTQLK